MEQLDPQRRVRARRLGEATTAVFRVSVAFPLTTSSPVNPFDPDETLGPDDPYDDLSELDYAMRLVNVDCDTVKSGSGTFDLTINPVVDGPDIILGGADVFDEDTVYDLGLSTRPLCGNHHYPHGKARIFGTSHG